MKRTTRHDKQVMEEKLQEQQKFDGNDEHLPLAKTEEDCGTITFQSEPAVGIVTEDTEIPTLGEAVAASIVTETKKRPFDGENGCYGTITIYCKREHGDCNFRAFEESSPAGLLWACLRCMDVGVKLNKGEKP